jgi:hypothetical protein
VKIRLFSYTLDVTRAESNAGQGIGVENIVVVDMFSDFKVI